MASTSVPGGRGSSRPDGFPKTERVRSRDEFTRILRNGQRAQGRFVSVCWVREAERAGAPNRVGIATGRKLGGAALRNRLKRRIREAYRRNKRELPCRGIAMVFLASPRMIGRSWNDVQEEIRDLLRRVADGSG